MGGAESQSLEKRHIDGADKWELWKDLGEWEAAGRSNIFEFID